LKNKAFIVGALLLLMTVAIDVLMYANGLWALALFSFIGTILVFASSLVWLVYRDDTLLYVRRVYLIIPLAIFGIALNLCFHKIPMGFAPSPENLEEVGNLLMSRYQIALWIVSTLIFFMFITSGSLMGRKRP
jgi:NADH:ubiquinone oxidoreductase subunit 6 (subunit J)